MVQGRSHGISDIKEANFKADNSEKADLKGTNLLEANLEGANFEEANLEKAHLEEAKLKGAKLEGANLQGVDLKGANLKEALNLLIDQLSKVKTLYNAKLDEKILIRLKEEFPFLFKSLEQQFLEYQSNILGA